MTAMLQLLDEALTFSPYSGLVLIPESVAEDRRNLENLQADRQGLETWRLVLLATAGLDCVNEAGIDAWSHDVIPARAQAARKRNWPFFIASDQGRSSARWTRCCRKHQPP